MKNTFSENERHTVTKAGINYYAQAFVHPERTMNEHDFIYMVQGEWKIGQNETVYHLKEDTILILAAGERHYGVSSCTPGSKTMYFHVSQENGDTLYPCSKKDSYNAESLIDASENPSLKRYFEHIVSNKLSGNQRKSDLYFDLLLCELSEKSSDNVHTDVAMRIKNTIHRNPEKFFSNKELAEIAEVSVKTAENKFKSAWKMTIHQYILDFKIKEAISVFESFPHMSIKEIACNLGFYDEYHFSRQFKKITGLSPRELKGKFHGR